jgi:uncharacterized protein
MSDVPDVPEGPPITELTKGQRRVLGTLVEKALTTPEAYPLTPKALTTGCNQKSNRYPMTDYSEDDVLQIVDELRQLGLVAVVHTESGRTERYRHYLRRRFTLTEPQVAILTELLLRGRQTVGDLRARASRMVAIENLDDLREALRGLIALNFVQSSGPLDRRGVEVDHAFYQSQESKKLAWNAVAESETDELVETREAAPRMASVASHVVASSRPVAANDGSPNLHATIGTLQDDNRELRARLDGMEDEIRRLKGVVDDLVRDLRG